MNRSTFNGVMMPLGGTKQVHRDISVCVSFPGIEIEHLILCRFHPIYNMS